MDDLCKMTTKSVFLTVGTTQFDQLVKAATDKDVCQVLHRLGYTTLKLQIGRGQFEPEIFQKGEKTLKIDFYRFKDSIADDIIDADLVISHAGISFFRCTQRHNYAVFFVVVVFFTQPYIL